MFPHSDAQWPWEKQSILSWSIDFKGIGTLPQKNKIIGTTGPLGNKDKITTNTRWGMPNTEPPATFEVVLSEKHTPKNGRLPNRPAMLSALAPQVVAILAVENGGRVSSSPCPLKNRQTMFKTLNKLILWILNYFDVNKSS